MKIKHGLSPLGLLWQKPLTGNIINNRNVFIFHSNGTKCLKSRCRQFSVWYKPDNFQIVAWILTWWKGQGNFSSSFNTLILIYQFFFFWPSFGGGLSHMMVLNIYSWLCTQSSILGISRDHMRCWILNSKQFHAKNFSY